MVPSTLDPAARRVVVVLGMHRSGTSLVAGCLQRAGVDFGPKLMPANPDNPHGYFEHNDVVNLHDRLLLALNRSWDETAPFPPDWWQDNARLAPYRAQLIGLLERDFPEATCWGLKDPRLCRLLPWWESVWPEVASRPLFILVRRHPAEVAASLARREGMSAPKAYLLWLQHTLEAERCTRPHERVFLNYRDCVEDEQTALRPVKQLLGLPMIGTGIIPRLADPMLGQSQVETGKGSLPSALHEVDAAWLCGLTGDNVKLRGVFNRVAEELSQGRGQPVLSLKEENADLRHQLEMTRRQARWYEAEWGKARAKLDKTISQPATAKKHRS